MTVNRGLWVPINTGNVGTTDVEARLADNALFETNDGVNARSGLLHPQSEVIVTGKANMSYDIAACNPVINRAAGEGVYRFTATGVTNVASIAAPGANSRIDVIWVKQNDQAKGDANNLAVAGVTNGVAAAIPAVPAIPAGAMEIARATVGANITATTNASITQTFKYAALKGAPITARTLAERAEITAPRVGQSVRRLDRNGHIQTWTGTAWTYNSAPERYYADPTTFSTVSNAASKLIGDVTGVPIRPYATKIRVNGRLSVSCGAIGSGALKIMIAVSAVVSMVGSAQGKSHLTFVPPGAYWETRSVETDWIPVAASGNPLVRLWIEHVSGAVNHVASAAAVESHLWAEVLPADD